MRVCTFCKTELDIHLEVFRSTTCPSCGKDLKICKHCRFYTPGAQWDCAETISDPVYDKENRNFCDLFRFKEGGAAGEAKKKECESGF